MNNLPWCSVIQKPWSVIHLSKKYYTVFQIPEKSRIQYCERSELRLHLDKSFFKMPKMVHFGENLKPKVCNQTVLSDRSLLKLVENAKIK